MQVFHIGYLISGIDCHPGKDTVSRDLLSGECAVIDFFYAAGRAAGLQDDSFRISGQFPNASSMAVCSLCA